MAKAPDSGLKLGFADIHTTGKASIASLQNTPSRPRQSLARTNISPSFQFKFSHEANMTEEGRKLMETIREDAAKIKEQMRAEKTLQEQRDSAADAMFDSAAGRRIAKPTARAGRFSDVHMAEFKKMDSIANHASAFRARPGFARPTAQSLKRSSSKADLDEPERPRTAGKSPARIPPPVTGRLGSTSPFKSVRPVSSDEQEAPAKRLRLEQDQDVTSSKTTALPRPVSSRLLSPTKASAARTSAGSSLSPAKPSAISRSNSIKSIRSIPRLPVAPASASRLPQMQIDKPLPPVPTDSSVSPIKLGLTRAPSTKSLADAAKDPAPSSSKIPTFAALKSILRSPKKDEATTPKMASTIPVPVSSQKKVDFTPSVKSRYAVKLAATSPSPAKLDRTKLSDKWEPAIPYDSSAFIINEEEEEEEEWDEEDIAIAEDNPVTYPSLPALDSRPVSSAGPVDHTFHAFQRRSQEQGKRESREFKSIFTETRPRKDSTSLTTVNTTINRTNPIVNAARVAASPQRSQPSPSSIRRVRNSEPVQPFEDAIQTVPHGLPGKKRRMESDAAEIRFGRDDDAKENRRMTQVHIPGAWNESAIEEDEGEKRGGKRARFTASEQPDKESERSGSPVKKPSAARELAAKTAKERKAKASIGGAPVSGNRSALSLSRLNVLARPKNRG